MLPDSAEICHPAAKRTDSLAMKYATDQPPAEQYRAQRHQRRAPYTASLARLLARRVDGIFLSDFEHKGPDLFRHACLMGREGLVSKRADSRYRGGRSPDWIKVKNRQHPALQRAWRQCHDGL